MYKDCNMNKKLLIKYLEGKTDLSEDKIVHDWVSKSSYNRKYFVSLKDMYIFDSLPNTIANQRQLKNLKKIKKSVRTLSIRRFVVYAAVILLFLSACFNLYLYTQTSKGLNITNKDLLSNSYTGKTTSLYTNRGVRAELMLPDGSTVFLNSDSKISYPQNFEGKSRDVSLDGEAYFKVKTDSSHPMIIKVRDIAIKVTGTEFNVRAYSKDKAIKTTLIKGKVSILSKADKSGEIKEDILLPKQSLSYDNTKNTKVLTYSNENINLDTEWLSGRITFDKTPLDKVITELERLHGYTIKVSDNRILREVFTASFQNESIIDILEILKTCSLITYSVHDKQILLSYK